MELWTADRVATRVESLAREVPGGIVAFDGDGTLWSGDVGEDLFHAFLQHGRVDAPARAAMGREARDHFLSDAGSGPEIARRLYEAYVRGSYPEERVCALMTWCFAGWSRPEVREFARAVVERGGLAARFQPEVLRVLEGVRRERIRALVVSASPIDVVIEAAAQAGFSEDDVVAVRPRFDADGIMLAEVEPPIPYAGGKVERLRERVGPERSIYAAFGDNGFDTALLASARVGVAVRPKARLRQRAHEVPGLVELEP